MYVNADDLNMATSYINQWGKSRYLCRLPCRLKTTAVLVVHISLPEVLIPSLKMYLHIHTHPHPHPHTPHTQAPPLKIQPQHGKVITYIMKCGMKLFIRFPNFNGYTIKVWEWISNFMIPHLTGQVITYQCWD